MFYLYILHSATSDIFYIGITDNPARRLKEHNESEHVTFTSKHRPWALKAVFRIGENRGDALKLEKFIKKNRSRRMMELLCSRDFVPDGRLAQLVINQRVVGSSPTGGAKH